MQIMTSSAVLDLLNQYPIQIQEKLLNLRHLILETAAETEGVDRIEETLKWGEPSYLVKNGSTIRIDWKRSKPDQYAMYFNCKTTLVETFREIYKDSFVFEGNRAIIFNTKEEFPVLALKHCISLALTYHRLKHLPLLGV